MQRSDAKTPGVRKGNRYDDGRYISRAREAMSDNPSLSRRAAILLAMKDEKHADEDSTLRRIQGNMARDDAEIEAQKRARIVEAHARRYPVVAPGPDETAPLDVVFPDPEFHEARIMLRVSAGEERPVVEFRIFDDSENRDGPATSITESTRLYEAARLFGLLRRESGGVMSEMNGPSPVVMSLAYRLAEDWSSSGVGRADDTQTAIRNEAERLCPALSSALARFPKPLLRSLAAYAEFGRFDPDIFARISSAGVAKIGLIDDLAVFAHPTLAAMEETDASRWNGRPLECLVTQLNQWATPKVDIGRSVDLADATWLHATFGRRALAPIDPATLESMLKWQARVDPVRLRSDLDAAGLVGMVRAILSWDRYSARRDWTDDGLRLLFARLDEDGRSYGECADALSKAAVTKQAGLVDAVVWATSGGEELCRQVAERLVAPTLAELCASVTRSADGRGLPIVLAKRGPWRGLLNDQVRTITLGGRRIDDLALQAPKKDSGAPSWRPFEFLPDGVDSLPKILDKTSLDAAWHDCEAMLASAWRTRGRRMLEDEFRAAVRSGWESMQAERKRATISPFDWFRRKKGAYSHASA